MRRVLPMIGGLIVGLGLGTIFLFGILKPMENPNQNNQSPGMDFLADSMIDAPAPDFELDSLSGEQVRLKDYYGQIVLLNFWATWCGPCRLEMPLLQSLVEKFEDEVVVVAVNNAENPVEVQAFVDDLNLNFDVLLDPEAEIQHLYRVRGYPTTFLIDTQGVIREQKIGLLTEKDLDSYLQELGLVP